MPVSARSTSPPSARPPAVEAMLWSVIDPAPICQGRTTRRAPSPAPFALRGDAWLARLGVGLLHRDAQAGDAQRPHLDLLGSRAGLACELDDPAVQPVRLRHVRAPVHAAREGLPDGHHLHVVVGRDAAADRGVGLRLAGDRRDGAAVGVSHVVIGDAVVRATQSVVALGALRAGRTSGSRRTCGTLETLDALRTGQAITAVQTVQTVTAVQASRARSSGGASMAGGAGGTRRAGRTGMACGAGGALQRL